MGGCFSVNGGASDFLLTVTVKEEKVARNRKLDLKKGIAGLGYGWQFNIFDRPFGIEIRGGTPVNRYHLFASYYEKL